MLARDTIDSIGRAVDVAQEILVITHIAPDGDAIGSLTAAGVALNQLGKRFTLVCDDGILKRYDYLPLADEIKTAPDRSTDYDLLIALDCGDTERMGLAFRSLPEPKPTIINIDHHITNTKFGDINVVGVKANATTEILFELFTELSLTITPELAECLLTGLVTDTLGFRTAAVNSKTLKIASALVDRGVDLFTVVTKALDLKDMSTLLIWQKGLSNMKLEDGLLWTAVSNRERLEAGHNGTSSFGLGNMMANVYEAAMSAVILEMGDGRVSVGFRSRPPYSVAQLAAELGGGGHHQASGCTIEGPLDKAIALVVHKSKESIRKQRNVLASEQGEKGAPEPVLN